MSDDLLLPKHAHVVNTLIVTEDARELIEFLKQVFGAKEDKNALAYSETDGKIFNSDVYIGDTHLNILDRKEGWKHTPSFLQVYVKNCQHIIEKAESFGADVITKPTPFYGGYLARFIDLQGNLWWVFEMGDFQESDWEITEEVVDDDAVWKEDQDSDMIYIHETLIEGMKKLNEFS